MSEVEVIRVKEEDGFKIFEKDQTDELESVFYRKEYFAMIGFEDAEIQLLDKATMQPLVTGGENGKTLDSVSRPYRDFLKIFRLSPSNAPVVKSESKPAQTISIYDRLFGKKSTVETPEKEPDSEPEPDIKQPLVKESEPNTNTFANRIGAAFSNVSTYLGTLTKPKNMDTEVKPTRDVKEIPDEQPEIQDKSVKTDTDVVSDQLLNSEVQPENPDSDTNQTVEPETTKVEPSASVDSEKEVKTVSIWVVKIPIVKDDGLIPKGKKEIEDEEFNQKVREYYAEKKEGVIVTGKIHKIGNRTLKICEAIKRGVPKLEISTDVLDGTLESKYAKLHKTNEPN